MTFLHGGYAQPGWGPTAINNGIQNFGTNIQVNNYFGRGPRHAWRQPERNCFEPCSQPQQATWSGHHFDPSLKTSRLPSDLNNNGTDRGEFTNLGFLFGRAASNMDQRVLNEFQAAYARAEQGGVPTEYLKALDQSAATHLKAAGVITT
jgi:hypothetical protein